METLVPCQEQNRSLSCHYADWAAYAHLRSPMETLLQVLQRTCFLLHYSVTIYVRSSLVQLHTSTLLIHNKSLLAKRGTISRRSLLFPPCHKHGGYAQTFEVGSSPMPFDAGVLKFAVTRSLFEKCQTWSCFYSGNYVTNIWEMSVYRQR
jgi:hypothetical protein